MLKLHAALGVCNAVREPMGLSLSQAQGASILESLHSQRQTIQRASGRLQEANESISTSQAILKRMGRWLPF